MDLNALRALLGRSVSRPAGQDARPAAAPADTPYPIEAFSAGPCSEGAVSGQSICAGADAREAPVGEAGSGGDSDRLWRLRGGRVSPVPAGERWDFAGPREVVRGVPRWGVLVGKVA